MNVSALVDPLTAAALQTSWLHAILEPASEFGRRAYAGLEPYRPGQEQAAQQHAEEIVQSARALTNEAIGGMRETLRMAPDPLPAISAAAMGQILDDPQLLVLLRFLDAARRTDAQPLSEPIRELAELLEPGRAGKFGFYLSETFDANLARARAAADRAHAEYEAVRGRSIERVAQVLGREDLGDEFIVMREAVTQLPPGVRIVREAPTYYLCELELDDSALAALRKRDEAVQGVAAAEHEARSGLSRRVRDCVAELQALLARLAQLDVRLAQARFAKQYSCAAARVPQAQELSFQRGSYLPLRAQLEAQGRAYEPISLDLRDAAVITGPNMGGKTIALRTCGFMALLVAFGLPVPARSARCGLFEEIAWLGIGAQEEAGGLLSSFAREVVRLAQILARPAAQMLVLIDEFARTTTPHEGRALLVALLRGLRRRHRLALIATHLAGIAREAGVRHFAVRGLRGVPRMRVGDDLQAALAALAESMDHSVEEVREEQPPQGDAIALARLLGLDDDVIAEAGSLLVAESGRPWTR